MTKQKILITGSCGFTMGNLVRKAIYEKQPYQIVSLDMVSAKSINSMYWNKNHVFHIADIRDQHTIDMIFQFEKPDIVIHGADESHGDSLTMVSTNILGTQNIIDACIKHKVEKFLYLSTNEISANHETLIPSLYHTTKISGAMLTLTASFSHKLPLFIIHLFKKDIHKVFLVLQSLAPKLPTSFENPNSRHAPKHQKLESVYTP
jgi:nucleoside-diphosphate-sugar epimerase